MVIKAGKLRIERYDYSDGEMDSASDYSICRIPADDDVRVKELIEKGFVFLDRKLCFQIDLKDSAMAEIKHIGIDKEIRFESGKFTDKMTELACLAFPNDRRFHLDILFDQVKANQIIDAYINNLLQRDVTIYQAVRGHEILGFTMAEHNMAVNADCFENRLGATLPGIKGKMIAYPLYTFMLENEYRNGMKRYLGEVSSINIASINLHYQLGGKVVKVIDEYIMRR